MEVNFIIPGTPVPKGRPRVTRAGHAYTPKKTADYEKLVKDVFKISGKYLGRGPLGCRMIFCFPIPQSYSKSKVKRISAGEIKHTKKPDIDNLCKIILDALNGLAYDDDAQIIKQEAIKAYTSTGEPYAYIKLYTM